MRYQSLLPLACVFIVGCSGELILPFQAEPCTGQNCPCQGPSDCPDHYDCLDNKCVLVTCSPFAPTGLCPAGRECKAGICMPAGTGDYCACTQEQACTDGICYDIGEENACGSTRVTGLCPMGSVCIGGTCNEITEGNACTPSQPGGLCPAGAACVEGYCLPISENRCSTANPEGRCAAGMVCVSPGICDYLPCSEEAPWGRCDIGNFCSSVFSCIPIGSCAGDPDCEALYQCDGGACVRNLACTSDDDCTSSEHCAGGTTCMPLGKCLLGADCGDGQICSTLGNCIDEGSCESSEDCLESGRCLSDKSCATDANQCAVGVDCPPGHGCNNRVCLQTGAACTDNAAIPDDTCLAAGTCCPQGQRCAFLDGSSPPAGVCVFDGQCLTDADCLTGYMTCGDDYRCQPTKDCESCAVGEQCSQIGGCVPNGSCGRDGDCEANEVCNALWACSADEGCGDIVFETTRVKPNMMIVLDRSTSMSDNSDFGGQTRWAGAKAALDTIIDDYGDVVRFGLVLFSGEGGQPGDTSNCHAGIINVPVGDDASLVKNTYNSVDTKRSTPAGITLRRLANSSRQDVFGTDYEQRGNYILFVTDGQPNCDPPDLTQWWNETQLAADRVCGAIDKIRTPPSPPAPQLNVNTYVIGLKLTGNAKLNCFAVHGGTSQCGSQVVSTGCTENGNTRECTCTAPSPTPTCYVPADDLAELEASLDGIVGTVASCSYALNTTPPDDIYVYLVEGETETKNTDWTYDPVLNQITFSEPTCTDKIKSGVATPKVIYACSSSG